MGLHLVFPCCQNTPMQRKESMKTSIRFRFCITYLVLAATMLLIMNYLGNQLTQNALIKQKKTSLYNEAEFIAREYVPDVDSLNFSLNASVPTLRREFSALESLSDTRFWLVDTAGYILVDSDTSHSQEQKNINSCSHTFLGNQTYQGTALKKLSVKNALAVIYPISTNQQTHGYIVLLYSLQTINRYASKSVDAVILCFFVFFLVLLLAFIFLGIQTIAPLKRMTKATEEYVNGHFDYPMGVYDGQDYRNLAGAIHYLADKTKNMNDYQRNFIANVSHDFRSPLTSIKGYTEAMKDGTIPPEMQSKYLDIILFETERLSKLTASLLELNQFENKSMHIEPSNFEINTVIRQALAAFEQRCTEKRISIRLTVSEPQLWVCADISKIEQVIQNLVDNAIKFSYNNSDIEINVNKRAGKIFISVKDHGIGIPKDSLGKIWNRFYKTDLSRGRDKTGTGLGLSITKEIIEAHNENINAISTEGAGTEFIFSLKEREKPETISS
jgi:signal transduction histidine kinase